MPTSTATTTDILNGIGRSSLVAWKTMAAAENPSWPPAAVTLIGLKAERRLEVWSKDDEAWRHLRDYPILGRSGGTGPKLREGDKQVPEGIYRVTTLNPQSRYHLSLRLNYPNALDLELAAAEGRTDPGSDIYIHGGTKSVGCLAMGDDAATDLFVLAATMDPMDVKVILAPRDFRDATPGPEDVVGLPEWTRCLYAKLSEELQRFPSAPRSNAGTVPEA